MESNPHIAQEIRRLEEQYAFRPDSLVFGRLADLHRKAGNPDRALDILDEGLRRHPRYLSAHIVRARCLRALDRDDEARRAFREVLELDGQNLVALRSLAEMALESGAHEEARRHLQALLRVDPRNDEARRMLAEAEAELAPPAGEASPPPSAATGDEAADLREQVDELDLGEPTATDDDGEMATRTLAGLYETQGFYREAVEMYERLLEERPASEAEEIRERLERARAALSDSGGRGSTTTSDEAPEAPDEPTTTSDEAVEDADDAGSPAPDARAHLRALLSGEVETEEHREPGTDRPEREGAGARR